ncbi:hypothetical protein EBU99_10185 [bacterium]|nr:hypothetical protein [bacterium]
MTSKEIKSAASSGLKKYQMEGRGGNYSVEIISPANLPLKPLTCASAASEIKTNNYPDITLPNVLWLLNYGSRLTLFSEASQRAWFNISLPAGVKFNKKLNAAMDAAGRLLVSDNTTVLFLDLQLDAALLFNPQSVYKTRWGAASAAFTAEWEAMNKHVLAFASEQRDRKPLFMLNGIAAGKHFWTWEKIISLLKGESPAPFYLPGELVTAGEKLTPTARVSTFATRDSEGKAQVSQFDSSRGTMTLVRKNLPLDHRARNEHFVLLEDDIYRFTADGLYKAESGAEVPTVLKGFKGTLKNQIHFLQSKEQVGKSCEMRIWSNKADFVGLLSTALSQLQCNQDEGFAVTPWAYSASWVSGGQVKTQVAAHD